MGLTLVDVVRWNPDDIHQVFQACISRAEGTRSAANGLGNVIQAVPWDGQAHDAALASNNQIRQDLTSHADECDAVGRAAAAAESKVRDVKARWAGISSDAKAAGITIDHADGTLSYPEPSDPVARQQIHAKADDLVRRIQQMMQEANTADQELAAAITAAAGKESAQALDDQLAKDGVETPEQAEKDVHNALGGNKQAADRVKHVLDSITDDQRAGKVPLTPEQASVLSQLQAQEHGMSIDALQTAEQRLGDDKGIIGDSWQLMSNPRINFPKTGLKPGQKDTPSSRLQGGFSQLPTSVQDVLKSPDILHADQTTVVADIVKDGNPAMQQGTDIDKGLMHKAASMMDTPFWHSSDKEMQIPPDKRVPWLDPVVSDVFEGAGRDHQAVHDVLTGGADPVSGHNFDGGKFMEGVTHRAWTDGGAAAGSLFDWTQNASGPQAKIAGEVAQAYSTYIGQHAKDLMHLPGSETLGQVNPKLVEGFAHGLAPYVGNIAGDRNDLSHWFHTPDSGDDVEHNRFPIAKGIFSVLSTDKDASDIFNGAANQQIIQDQVKYAQLAAQHTPGLIDHDADLQAAARLQGLVDGGINNAVLDEGLNHDDQLKKAYEMRKSAYDLGLKAVSLGASHAPGSQVTGPILDNLGPALEKEIVGPPPTPTAHSSVIPQADEGQAYRQVLDGLLANHTAVNGLTPDYLTQVDPNDPSKGMRVRTYAEMQQTGYPLSDLDYHNALSSALGSVIGTDTVSRIDTNVRDAYNGVVNDPHPYE